MGTIFGFITEIATIMAEFGYDSAVIGEGEALLAQASSAYDFNKK
jgi:hypothetical protein